MPTFHLATLREVRFRHLYNFRSVACPYHFRLRRTQKQKDERHDEHSRVGEPIKDYMFYHSNTLSLDNGFVFSFLTPLMRRRIFHN